MSSSLEKLLMKKEIKNFYLFFEFYIILMNSIIGAEKVKEEYQLSYKKLNIC